MGARDRDSISPVVCGGEAHLCAGGVPLLELARQQWDGDKDDHIRADDRDEPDARAAVTAKRYHFDNDRAGSRSHCRVNLPHRNAYSTDAFEH